MKRTPLKRKTPMKSRARKAPKFPDGLHDQVLKRDGMCIIKKLVDPEHICADANGPHDSSDLSRLTVDHFWLISGGIRGMRAPHTLRYLVAMCWKANFDGPSREVRDAERTYSVSMYGDED